MLEPGITGVLHLEVHSCTSHPQRGNPTVLSRAVNPRLDVGYD
jgi:hypothetical protein